jgi:zinc protease
MGLPKASRNDPAAADDGEFMKRFTSLLLVIVLGILIAAPAPAADGQLKLPPFKKVKLKNGLTVMLMEQHEVPIISFNFVIKAGSVADPKGKDGLADVTASLLRKGTRNRTADQISSELDFIGGQLDAGATFDYTQGSAEFVKKDINKGLDLLSDVLLQPTFPQDEVKKILQQRADELKAAKDQAQAVIGNYFSAYLYGDHPYARPTEGDETTIAAITRDDVAKFYDRYYTAADVILAAVGDFNIGEMEKLLSDKFGGWKSTATSAISLPEVTDFQGKKLLLVDKPDATQTFFQIGNAGITRTNADRVYIQVINTLFGGRFTSMLNTELRIKTGLTYGARSTFNQRKARGPFVISSYTRNETTEEAINLALVILKRLHEQGVTEEELKSAKTYLKGQFPPTIETSDQLARLLTELEFYGLGEDDVNGYYAKVDSMTMADAQRIIKQFFPLDNLVFVLIGKASEIETVAKKYAPKFEKISISQPRFGVSRN